MEAQKTEKGYLRLLLVTAFLFVCVAFSIAQPVIPQRTITIIATQAIHFGTVCLTGGTGGTVTVGYNGSRISTGDLLLISSVPTAQPAIFEIKLCQGRTVSIEFDTTIPLYGSNGGSLTLDLGPTEKGPSGSSFSTNNDCNFITPLRMGGTLHIPGTAIPGIYTGNFALTFNQE